MICFCGEHKFKPSYDLWEEFEGESLYSLSVIFAAFGDMLVIYDEVKEFFKEKNRLKLEKIATQKKNLEKKQRDLRAYILKTFYDSEKGAFVRNTVDRKVDISILGSIVPCKLFKPKEKKVLNTIEKIEMTLRTYTGGYIRYEGDNYMGGFNPWPIATLWMAQYNLLKGDRKKAVENISFVVNSAHEHGFLGEQVDNSSMQPMWVIGLTWSHAMFVLVLKELSDLGLV